MKKVAILIIDYNSHQYTLKCLDSLRQVSQEDHIHSVHILDNASTEPLSSTELPSGDRLNYYRSEENLGFTGGNNFLFEKASSEKPEYYLLLNNDTRVDPQAIDQLVTSAENHPTVGSVSPVIYFEKGHEFHQIYDKEDLGKVIWFAGGSIDWRNMYAFHRGVDEVNRGQLSTENKVVPNKFLNIPNHSYETMDFASGCCVLFPRKVIEEVGMFDDSYFLYWEDVELSHRIRLAGYQLYLCPEAVIWHANAGSSGGSGSQLHRKYQERNRKRFGLKYASLRTKMHMLLG